MPLSLSDYFTRKSNATAESPSADSSSANVDEGVKDSFLAVEADNVEDDSLEVHMDVLAEGQVQSPTTEDLDLQTAAAFSFEAAFADSLVAEPPAFVNAQDGKRKAEWDSASSSSSESTSSSSSSSEDESSSDDDPDSAASETSEIAAFEQEEDCEDGTASKVPPKTKNEAERLPPVAPPSITRIPDNFLLVQVGTISSILGELVVVESHRLQDNNIALDVGSILAFGDRVVLGEVDDTFGPVHQPLYAIRFNCSQDMDKERTVKGARVFQCPDYSKVVFTAQLRQLKGSDASNIHDEEVPEAEQEYSDDEKERDAKQQRKKKNMMQKSQLQGSQELQHPASQNASKAPRQQPQQQDVCQPPFPQQPSSTQPSFVAQPPFPIQQYPQQPPNPAQPGYPAGTFGIPPSQQQGAAAYFSAQPSATSAQGTFNPYNVLFPFGGAPSMPAMPSMPPVMQEQPPFSGGYGGYGGYLQQQPQPQHAMSPPMNATAQTWLQQLTALNQPGFSQPPQSPSSSYPQYRPPQHQ